MPESILYTAEPNTHVIMTEGSIAIG